MSGHWFGGGGSAVKPVAAPAAAPVAAPVVAAPTQNTEAVKEAAKREADMLRKRRRGFTSTILTGPSGVTGATPGTKTTLG